MLKKVNPQQFSVPQIKAKLLPVLVGILLCSLVGVLWLTLKQHEEDNLQYKIKAESEYMATHLDADLQARISFMQRMVRRWEISGGTLRGEFMSEARSYMLDAPGFQALEWVDKDLTVRWIVPVEGNEKARNLNLAFEEKRRSAMEKAMESKIPTATSAVELVQGGKGFLIFFPLNVNGEPDGFILSVFRIHEWLDYVFSINVYNLSDNFRYSAYLDSEPVFEQSGWEDNKASGFESMVNTKILERRLTIRIRPTLACVERNKTMLPTLTAVLGLLLSVLVAFVVYLLQKAYVEAFETHAARVALEAESQVRKKVEDDLKSTLLRLDMATKVGGIGVWEWDIMTDNLTWNDQMHSLYDVPLNVNPTYQTWRNVIHPEDLALTESLLKDALHDKGLFNTEFRIIRTTGGVQYLGAAARLERDHTGKPWRMTGINWDMTENKRKERELKDLISKLQKALDEINTLKGIVPICSHCKKIRDDKGFWEQVEAYVGKHTGAKFSHGVCPDCMTEHYSEYVDAAEPRTGQKDVLKPEEKAACDRVPCIKEDEKPGTSEDSLVIGQDEWERTFDAVPEMIAMVDMKHRIIRANLPMAEKTGISCDKLAGLYLYKVIHGVPSTPENCPSLKTLANGKVEHAEMRIAHLGGTFDVITTPLRDSEGQVSGYVYVSRDITAQKLAEAEHEKVESQLRQVQKMEAIGQLAGGVAHDFNNMLSVIIGYSDILLEEMPSDDPAYSRIQEISSAGKRSADLTRQLLAFARKQVILPKVLDINSDIESMMKMLGRLLGENIELIFKPASGLWKVKMDPSQVHQILVNLTVNSRDAISGVGKLIIGTANANHNEEFYRNHPYFIPGKYVLLSVSDNGCGMSKETVGRIFEPFFTTKKAGEGTGLGLATVFGIVKQNNGFINVYSEPGIGSTFKIYLPRHFQENAGKDDKMEKAKIITGSETVLLVEDEAPLLMFAKAMLERLGYKVLAAGSPSQAIKAAGEFEGRIHLLMTDMVLPEMSGLELGDNIIKTRPDIKCLFMSGYTADIMQHNGIMDEGIHFLEKPFTMDDLSAKLREALAV